MAVVFLVPTAGSAGILDASWMSPTTNVDGGPLADLSFYRVYYATGSTPCPGSSAFEVAAASPSPTASDLVRFRLTGLTSGATYFVAVTAVNSSGNESACSSVAAATARSDSETSQNVIGSVSTSSQSGLDGGGGGILTLTSLTASLAAPQPLGARIVFTATAAGGIGPYQFKWWLSDGVNWTVAKDWATSNAFVWTPTMSNQNYSVGVWARSLGETADQPSGYPASSGAHASLSFPIQNPGAPLILTSLTADLGAPQTPGSTVTFAATATGGTAPYEFKWWVWNGAEWALGSDWTINNRFVWVPSTSNYNYSVGVWVRSLGETADLPSGYPSHSGAYASTSYPIQ